jgi:hypothetical protein
MSMGKERQVDFNNVSVSVRQLHSIDEHEDKKQGKKFQSYEKKNLVSHIHHPNQSA